MYARGCQPRNSRTGMVSGNLRPEQHCCALVTAGHISTDDDIDRTIYIYIHGPVRVIILCIKYMYIYTQSMYNHFKKRVTQPLFIEFYANILFLFF